jgi:hypothetical protein
MLKFLESYMQKTKVRAACLVCLSVVTLVAGLSSVQAQPVAIDVTRKDNIKTVDALIKLENTKALAESHKAAETMGFGAASVLPASGKPQPPPPATLTVDSISGINGELQVDLIYSGMPYERVQLGSRIGPCELRAIEGTRVTLGVVQSSTKKMIAADQCPAASWTGMRAPVVDRADFAASGSNGMPRMPSNLMPPIPFPAAAATLPTGLTSGVMQSPRAGTVSASQPTNFPTRVGQPIAAPTAR